MSNIINRVKNGEFVLIAEIGVNYYDIAKDEEKQDNLDYGKNNELVGELEYEEEIFTVITDNNYKEVIFDFCEIIFRNSIFETVDTGSDVIHSFMLDLSRLLEQLPRPYTIVQEFYHIDPSYRDTYYTYFSNQHFQVRRYSRRLSFFAEIMSEEDFFVQDEERQKRIAEHFMGACVINPLTTGVIGRTLINPLYVLNPTILPVYVRLSKFELNVYGKKFYVNAFPYRMQDEETMRCAEVSLLNLLEY